MGALQAVVFDWAGTTVDFGSRAPMGVFVEAFKSFDIDVTIAEARGPMGMAKRPHIAALMQLPRIAEQWRARYGKDPDDAAIDAVYDVFVPKNAEVVVDYADLIPGTAETVAALRARGLKIGSTTGYTRDIMAPLLPIAAEQGYAPDCLVCTGDTKEGRPAPLMLYRCMLDLGAWPSRLVVKVDDTEVGIEAGLNAGCWTVGVALTGNACGLSLEELSQLAPEELAAASALAEAKLYAAGAHYVIDGIADLLPVIDRIEGRLARGERP
ncbi:MAG: phosphonoacetaldehyde hydrolase [Geminicoccaceae bacterium]